MGRVAGAGAACWAAAAPAATADASDARPNEKELPRPTGGMVWLGGMVWQGGRWRAGGAALGGGTTQAGWLMCDGKPAALCATCTACAACAPLDAPRADVALAAAGGVGVDAGGRRSEGNIISGISA